MTTISKAVIKGGQPILDTPVSLPDGTLVTVRLEAEDVHPLVFLAKLAQPTGIPDLADQHDHYIYGTPKRTASE